MPQTSPQKVATRFLEAAKWPHPTMDVEIVFDDKPHVMYVIEKGALVWFLQQTYNIKPPSAKYKEIVSGNFTLPKAWKKALIEAGAVKYEDGPFGNGPNGGPTLPDGSVGKLARSEKEAGWTQGVYDVEDYRERITGPLLKSCGVALEALQQMTIQNVKYLGQYSMAGMEYREERMAAIESQQTLRKYGGVIQDLQEAIRKMGSR